MRAALVADARNDPQIFHPLVEFFVDSAEGATARKRQIHIPQKIQLHSGDLIALPALGTGNRLTQNIILRVFDVVREFPRLLSDGIVARLRFEPAIAFRFGFCLREREEIYRNRFVVGER